MPLWADHDRLVAGLIVAGDPNLAGPTFDDDAARMAAISKVDPEGPLMVMVTMPMAMVVMPVIVLTTMIAAMVMMAMIASIRGCGGTYYEQQSNGYEHIAHVSVSFQKTCSKKPVNFLLTGFPPWIILTVEIVKYSV